MRHLILALSALLLISAAPASTDASFEVLRQADLRVAGIGERLAAASLDLCPGHGNRVGLLLHDIRQYEGDEEVARRVFGFSTPVSIEAVVPGSAAAQAGLVANDGLVAIEGMPVRSVPVPGKTEQPENYVRMDAVWNALEKAEADGSLNLTIRHDGQDRDVVLAPTPGCATRFQLVPGDGYDASADGTYVQVGSSLYDYAASDDELAAILAHEFSHNLLHHRARLKAADVSMDGLFSGIGSNAAKIRATENEADRLSVYLLKRAGYDPEAAVRFWDRYGHEHGHGIFSDSTHLRVGKRVKQLEQEIASLNAKVADGRPLIPDFLDPASAAPAGSAQNQ